MLTQQRCLFKMALMIQRLQIYRIPESHSRARYFILPKYSESIREPTRPFLYLQNIHLQETQKAWPHPQRFLHPDEDCSRAPAIQHCGSLVIGYLMGVAHSTSNARSRNKVNSYLHYFLNGGFDVEDGGIFAFRPREPFHYFLNSSSTWRPVSICGQAITLPTV